MATFPEILTTEASVGLRGEIEIPADKSIAHRSLIIGALAGASSGEKLKISNFSFGADCRSTLKIMEQLGVKVEFLDEKTLILDASEGFKAPLEPLDCGNSGTTMRLMSGVLAGQDFDSTLVGDESLSKRPMGRVIEPLELMGAKIESSGEGGKKAPLKIQGQKLRAIEYNSKIASAQVKSCILLAGLSVQNSSQGETIFSEPTLSRDHTERMLKYFGADIRTEQDKIKIRPSKLKARDLTIAGDISSATFFLIAGAIVPNSDFVIKNTGLNPTRTGILDVLNAMGADFEIFNEKAVSNEPVGDIRIKYTENLRATEISGDIIPRLIDELPAIAVLASQAQGKTIIKDAQDLRNKESDRISAVTKELQKLGVKITETADGFEIEGKNPIKPTPDTMLEVYHDHRLAMSWFLAGLISEKPFKINGFQWAATSFPEFLELFGKLSVY